MIPLTFHRAAVEGETWR